MNDLVTVTFRKRNAGNTEKVVSSCLAYLREILGVTEFNIGITQRLSKKSDKKTDEKTRVFTKFRIFELKTQVLEDIHVWFFDELKKSNPSDNVANEQIQSQLNHTRESAKFLVDLLDPGRTDNLVKVEFAEQFERLKRSAERLSRDLLEIGFELPVNEQNCSHEGLQRLAGFELLHRLRCTDSFVLAKRLMILAVCEALRTRFEKAPPDKTLWDTLVAVLHRYSLLPILQISRKKTFSADICGYTIMCHPDLTIIPRLDLLPTCRDPGAISRVVLFEEHKYQRNPIESLKKDSLSEKMMDSRTFGDYLLHSLLQALKMEILNRGRAYVVTHHQPSIHSPDAKSCIIEHYSATDYAIKLAKVLQLLAEFSPDPNTDASGTRSNEQTSVILEESLSQVEPSNFCLKSLETLDVTPETSNQVIRVGEYNILTVRAFSGPLTQRWLILPFICAVYHNTSLLDPFGPKSIHAVLVVDGSRGYLFDLTRDNRFENVVLKGPTP